MDTIDYYSGTVGTVSTKVGYGLGRGARTVQVVTNRISPAKAVATVMLAWGAIAGIINYRRYKKGKLQKGEAIAVTANESIGMGLAAGAGLMADGLLNTYLLTAATASVVPLAVGVAATGATKIAWDCFTKRNMMWCGQPCQQIETQATARGN